MDDLALRASFVDEPCIQVFRITDRVTFAVHEAESCNTITQSLETQSAPLWRFRSARKSLLTEISQEPVYHPFVYFTFQKFAQNISLLI
jgi:hypothetical protein